jgi:hypothetical protein
MKTLTIAAFALVAACGTARAEQPMPQACGAELDQFKKEWNDIALPTGSKPAAHVTAPGGHSHSQGEVDMMMFHAKEAVTLCREGKDHEALLHMDLVRAWLKLPDIPHPASHNYLLK